MSPTNGIACLSLGLLVGLRFLSSLIGCILIGRRFSFSCAGRLRHNQSHLWTHRSFSLPGCRAVVILVVPLFCSVFSWPSRPSNRNKGMTTIDHCTKGNTRPRRSLSLHQPAFSFVFSLRLMQRQVHERHVMVNRRCVKERCSGG